MPFGSLKTFIFFPIAVLISFQAYGAENSLCATPREKALRSLRNISSAIINPESCKSTSTTKVGTASFYGCRDYLNKPLPGRQCDSTHGLKGFCETTFLSNQMTVALPQGLVARPGAKPSPGQVTCGGTVRLTNPKNGKIVLARVMDTGGFAKYGRIVDVSSGVASKLGFVASGTTQVKMEFCGN